MNEQQTMEMTLPLTPAFLPVAAVSVEETSRALGLGDAEAKSLALATEEIMAYLADYGGETRLQLTCSGFLYGAELRLRTPAGALPLSAFNLTTELEMATEESWGNLPFVLAARMTDEMWIEPQADGYCTLVFRKEKRYPTLAVQEPAASPEWQAPFSLRRPDAALLKEWCSEASCREAVLPAFFRYPGKLVDMVASGQYDARVALDRTGRIAGGTMWKVGARMAEGFGPYAWMAGVAAALLDDMLAQLARSGALFLVIHYSAATMPREYFEELGTQQLTDLSGCQRQWPVWYRQLAEDNGATIRVDARLAVYLQREYQRLALPREVRAVETAGETLTAEAAFAVHFRTDEGIAVLRPLLAGKNAVALLRKQVRILRAQGFNDVRAMLDLGIAELAMLGGEFLTAGFSPFLLLPWGGQGDLLLFRYDQGDQK